MSFTQDTSKDGLDLSTEEYRIYTFPDGSTARVDYPTKLWVKRSVSGDSHRIALENGDGVYIPSGWIKIQWRNKAGSPPVAW